MKQSADPEFVAMRRVVETLKGLEPAARQRVLDYAHSRIKADATLAAPVENPSQPKLL